MKTKNNFLRYLRLIRPQGASATAATILIGSLIMGLRDIFLLSIIFIIGVISHIFVFVLNEYVDIQIDRKSKDLQEKPLVSGIIPKQHAIFIAILSGFLVYVLTIFFFPSPYTIIFLSLALFLGGIYDFYGKKIPGSDGILASGCLFICLFGASTVSINFTNLIYIVALSCFFHIVFNNAVEGGLKDVDHDFIAGAKTTVTRLGVKINDGKLKISKKFLIFSYAIKLAYIGLVILAGFQPELNLWRSKYFILQTIVIFLIVIVFFTLYKFWHPSDFNRPKLIKLFSIHEISAYSIGPIILIPLVGYWVALLLLLIPILWFIVFNIILYGKPMQPQV